MKLTEKQARVLSSAHLQAAEEVSHIAREAKVPAHAARYVLSDLAERQIIRPFPVVNIQALGLTDYCIFLSLTCENEAPRKRVLEYFSSSPRTAWIAELSGEYHYTVSLFARDPYEVDAYFNGLAKAAPGVVVEKAFAIRTMWVSFRCKYLSAHKCAVDSIVRGHAPRVRLDATDNQVLMALSAMPVASYAAQARKAQLPPSTFEYRVKSLKAKGVLLGTAYYVEVNKLGLHAFRILIQAKRPTGELASAICDFARRHINITAFVACIGNWDYELNIEVKEPTELAAILDSVHERFGQALRSVKTVTVLSSPKTKPYPFADETWMEGSGER